MPWDASALLMSPEEAAANGFHTGHAARVQDDCWLCWRYTAEAMAALVADQPIPPAPAHWERYCREWWGEAFDGQ
jgi:hypothetical protein